MAKIVLGIDGSEPSLAAANWVAAMFGEDSAVWLVHAVPDVPFLSGANRERFEEIADGAALERLYQAEEILLSRKRLTLHRAVRQGEPSLALTSVAREQAADLIAVGGHRRSLWRFLFPSPIARRLVRNGQFPVVVVPPGAIRS
jgi:nucleotide-binding universal stress UspA family protein